MRRHVPPLRAVSDEFTCDQFHHSQRSGQHDVIEVDALAQHPGLDVRTLTEVRFQVAAGVLDQLFGQWPVREDGKAADLTQRMVFLRPRRQAGPDAPS